MNRPPLQDVACWWALSLPIQEAKSILRRAEDPWVRKRAGLLAHKLFEDLPLAAQETVVAAYMRALYVRSLMSRGAA